MKYTDEELSRILSEHAAGQLIRAGSDINWTISGTGQYPVGCVNQAAYNESCSINDEDIPVFSLNAPMAKWFDYKYETGMTPEDLLHKLEKLGT